MPVYKQSSKIGQIYKGNTKIGKVYKGSTLVYQSARNVTYVIDSGNSVTKAVGNGADAISNAPAASKSGWSFVGWRSDTSANGSVHGSYSVNTDGIVLYAVFARTIYLYYNGNGATSGGVSTQSGTQYYNNGNTSNCSFQVQGNGFGRSGYSFSCWTGGGSNYSPSGWITIGDSFTLYAVWYRTPVTNYTLASGSGKKGATTMYFDTTGYSSVTITIHVWSVWAWVYFINYASDMSGMPYTFYAKEGTETTRSISLSANAGAQPFSFKVNPESGYGGNDGNTSWSITVTAS